MGRHMEQPIIIPFGPSGLGRIEFKVQVQTGNGLSLGDVTFKLDSGSDFTTLSCEDLESLGYTQAFLQACPFHHVSASAASSDVEFKLQYLKSVAIKLGEHELKGCRIFFILGSKLRSLLGCDILKYFNYEINYDKGEMRLNKAVNAPELSRGETPIHIYLIES